MTNRVLWLLSYIGLSLALALGNRQTTTIGAARAAAAANDQHRGLLASEAMAATGYRLQSSPTNARHNPVAGATSVARNAVHDWLVYDKRSGPEGMLSSDRLVLLDDVLSVVLGNFYRQQQQHQQQQQQQQRHHQDQRSPVSQQQPHPLSFLYDEDEDELDDELDASPPEGEEENEVTRTGVSEPRILLAGTGGTGRGYDSAAMYLEALAPLEPLVRPRPVTNERTSLRRSGLVSLGPAKPPGKRNQLTSATKEAHQTSPAQQPQQQQQAVAAAGASMASQFMLRSARGNRQYDVPQIECPLSDDGMERFACPTADRMGRYRCIDDHVLCDGFIDCPAGEDEDRQACMFYKTTKAHLDVLADALLRWARGR